MPLNIRLARFKSGVFVKENFNSEKHENKNVTVKQANKTFFMFSYESKH